MRFESIRKTNQIFLFIGLIMAGLFLGASLLIPVTFAVFFAALILPIVKWLQRKTGLGNSVASFIGTLLIFLLVGGLIFFFIPNLVFFFRIL